MDCVVAAFPDTSLWNESDKHPSPNSFRSGARLALKPGFSIIEKALAQDE